MSGVLPSVISYFALTALVFTVLLFLKAALFKAFDFLEFQGFVADYQLMPDAWVRPVAFLLITLESAVVLALIWDATRTVGIALATSLLGLYALAILINLKRGRNHIECGCGGAPEVLSPRLLVRNLLLMVIALMPMTGLPEALSLGETLLPLCAGLFMFVTYSLFEQISANVVAIHSPKL